MVIGINGYSGSGKDTLGIIIQYLNCRNTIDVSIEEAVKDYNIHQWWLEEQSEWEVKKFAGKLKDIASYLTGIEVERFEDQNFKKTNLGKEWAIHGLPMTVRDLLQKLGTEALRDGLHENVWVNALFADYKRVEYGDEEQGDFPNWIITDTRYINEAKAIKDKGGIVIRIDRPGVEPINNHPSETGLDSWKFDYKVVNNSDLFDLKEAVKQILKHAKML